MVANHNTTIIEMAAPIKNWVTSTANHNSTINGGTSAPIKLYEDIISKPSIRLVILMIYLIVILVAILGNILVILVISRRRSLRRNPAILLILNLAFCDLISCVVYRPLLLIEMFLPFTSIELFHDQLKECKASAYFQGLLAGVGFHSMVLISQERLMLIAYPLKAKVLCTNSRTIKMLAVIWLLASVCYLPVPLIFEEIRTFNIDGTLLSFCGYYSGSTSAIIYYSFIFAFYFVIPLVFITVAYAKIFKVLYQRLEHLDVTPATGGSKSLHTRRKLAKMMLGVSVIFAICWGPNFAFFLWVACGLGISKNGFFIATIVEFLPIISSAINPFIYTLNSNTFKSGLKHILCARFLCRPRLEESSLYRSFNSLYYPPTCGCGNMAASPRADGRRSTWTRDTCRRSISMPMGATTNTYNTHNTHVIRINHSPNLISHSPNRFNSHSPNRRPKSSSIYTAHARRNTFCVYGDCFDDESSDSSHSRDALRKLTVSNTCLNARLSRETLVATAATTCLNVRVSRETQVAANETQRFLMPPRPTRLEFIEMQVKHSGPKST